MGDGFVFYHLPLLILHQVHPQLGTLPRLLLVGRRGSRGREERGEREGHLLWTAEREGHFTLTSDSRFLGEPAGLLHQVHYL